MTVGVVIDLASAIVDAHNVDGRELTVDSFEQMTGHLSALERDAVMCELPGWAQRKLMMVEGLAA